MCRRREGYNEGLEEGAHLKAIEVAKKILSMNLSPEQASQITGLPLEEVRKLTTEIFAEQI